MKNLLKRYHEAKANVKKKKYTRKDIKIWSANIVVGSCLLRTVGFAAQNVKLNSIRQ